jgi:hypothetical protein
MYLLTCVCGFCWSPGCSFDVRTGVVVDVCVRGAVGGRSSEKLCGGWFHSYGSGPAGVGSVFILCGESFVSVCGGPSELLSQKLYSVWLLLCR